jgi:hypothetical protein
MEPIGVPFTQEEKKRVEYFRKNKIDGHIRQYPIPCVKSRRHFDLRVTQYRKVEDGCDNWVVDPDLHRYEDLKEKEFQGQKLENAKTRPASTLYGMPIKKAIKKEDIEETLTGYETAGRTLPTASSRNAPFSSRLEEQWEMNCSLAKSFGLVHKPWHI